MEEQKLYRLLSEADEATARLAARRFLADSYTGEGRLRLVDSATAAHLVTFEANSVKYSIRTAEEGIGLRRFSKLREYMSRLGFEATLADQLQVLRKIEQHFNKAEYVKAAAGIIDMQQALVRAGRPYPAAVDACALFIFAEGEKEYDLPSEADVLKKADDWAKAGLHEVDFFSLALQYSAQWSEMLQGFSLLLMPVGGR